jgi:hypothetical protein
MAAKVEAMHARGQAQATSPVKLAEVAPVKSKKSGGRPPLKIPPILLEGDNPPAPLASGPGRRYALGPGPLPAPFPLEAAPLPESYGTQKLYLTARDPHWLYAHWDFSTAQLKSYNALSAEGHQVLRLHQDSAAAAPVSQIQLHPESRHWFVPAPHAGTKYLVTLGYYDSGQSWVETARSGATLTPSDSLAEEKVEEVVSFAAIPVEVPFEALVETVQAVVRESPPLAAAVQELQAEGLISLPQPAEVPGTWTPIQEKALAAVVKLDESRRVWVGPVEITEVIRRHLQQAASSIAAAQFGQPAAPGAAGPGGAPAVGVASPAAAFGAISSPSPSGERQKSRSFWFNLNAELIIYGATEADATVEIGGRKIRLRKDGSFSFRFALPDGSYGLPVTAASADGEETRTAELSFSRASQYHGGVGAHPQDATLKAPTAEAVG